MHMADALLSPAVGGAMWAVSAGALAYAAREASRRDEPRAGRAPLMGVMGAFVFAAQMINFSIPGTGSSGHIAGALLLCAVLGAPAALLSLAVILTIQALCFADGGILALGANVFNMGIATCFVAYPLIFRPMIGRGGASPSPARITGAALLTAVAGLQLGACAVTLETLLSGKTTLPFAPFLLLMQPIHLAIGIGEGLITAALLLFLRRAAPETVPGLTGRASRASRVPVRALALLAAMALVSGVLLSRFASGQPDGLEWSVEGAALAEPEAEGGLHGALEALQARLAFLPDYDVPADAGAVPAGAGGSLAGAVGVALTLAVVALIGLALYLPKRLRRRAPGAETPR